MQKTDSEKYVLVVGDANVDLIVRYPELQKNGQYSNPEPQLWGGGSAANTAHALKKLGLPVHFMGTVGADSYGKYVQNELKNAGINTEELIVDPSLNTVCVFAFVREDGERSLWPWPKEQQSFRYLDIDKVNWDIVENASWVHSSGMVFSSNSSARHTVSKIMERANALSIPTSFDLNLRKENDGLNEGCRLAVLSVIEHCQYVLGSADEEFLYLRTGKAAKDPIEEAESFASENRVIIARMGSGGSLAITPCWQFVAPAIPVKVVDTIGAGDAFNAGFIAARLQNLSLKEAIQWGNALGAYAVSHIGSKNTPNLLEVQEMLKYYVK